jgi:hypothetical protein
MKPLLLTSLSVLLGILLLRVIVQRFVPLPRYAGPELLPEPRRPSGLMPEADFWRLIEGSRGGLATYPEQLATLGDELARLDTGQIRRFERTRQYLLLASHDERLWQAATAVNGNCGPECFASFRGWLMAQGRDKFYWTLRHPRLLLLTGRSESMLGYEGLAYVAAARYKDQAGYHMPPAPPPGPDGPGPALAAARGRYPELWLLVW